NGSGYSPVPGNLGQVWLGVIPNQFFTVSQASIELNNNLEMRNKEFGSILPRGISPGNREVSVNLELFSQDDEVTAALYQAARQEKTKMEASLLGEEIDRVYVEWRLEAVLGLELDAFQATPEMLIERGPEDLFREALEAVRHECGLSETERKN